jgi:hypothetical protein
MGLVAIWRAVMEASAEADSHWAANGMARLRVPMIGVRRATARSMERGNGNTHCELRSLPR